MNARPWLHATILALILMEVSTANVMKDTFLMGTLHASVRTRK